MLDISKKEKENFWQVFAKEIGGNFIEREYWHSAKTEISYREWKIIFDNYTEYKTTGDLSLQETYTRVIVPFTSVDKFRFQIYRKTALSAIGKLFGAQDIEIGIPDFDRDFMIKSNNAPKIKSLLQNEKIRDLIQQQKDINIETSDQKGIWEEKLPDNVLELSCFAVGKIRDIETLKSLLSLFREMIDQLSELNSINPTTHTGLA